MFCGFGGYGYGGYGFGSYGSVWPFIFMGFRLLFFVGIAVLAYKLIKQYGNKSRDAVKILDIAYAKGEISDEEYMKRKNALNGRS